MPDSKWRVPVIGLLLLAAAVFVYLVQRYPLSIATQSQLAKSQPWPTDEAASKKAQQEAPKEGLADREALNSTPSEHDQLFFSATLEGTHIDGALRANSDGMLILDIGVRDFFDYFLSIADDVGAEQAIAEIQRYALGYLPQPASQQAVALLGNYLRYKQTEFQIQQTPITQSRLDDSDALQLLRTNFDQLKRKRQNLFSPDQDKALFGLEDNYARHTLSSLELMADDTTTNQQKREQLEALESQLPAQLSASFTQTRSDRQRQFKLEEVVGSSDDDAQVYEQLQRQGLEQAQIEAIVSRRQQQQGFDKSYQRYQSEMQNLDSRSESYKDQVTKLQKTFFVSPEDRTQAKLRDLKQD